MLLKIFIAIVTPSLLLFAYDVGFGCIAATRSETGRCDGTITPFLVILSIIIALIVIGVIAAVRSIRGRPDDPAA